MKIYLCRGFFCIMLIYISCEKDILQEDKYIHPIELELADEYISFKDFTKTFIGFRKNAIEKYTLKKICSCDCKDLEILPSLLKDFNSVNPLFAFKTSKIEKLNCVEIHNSLTIECLVGDEKEFISKIDDLLNILYDNTQISLNEAHFIKNLLNDILNGTFKVNKSRKEWYELKNSNNKYISAILIEVYHSLMTYYLEFPYLVEIREYNDYNEEDVFLWWKAASIVGGAAGNVISDLIADVVEHGTCGACSTLTGKDLAKSALKGALVGALR